MKCVSGIENSGRSWGGKGGDRNYGRFDDRASNLFGIGLFSLFFLAVMSNVIWFWPQLPSKVFIAE